MRHQRVSALTSGVMKAQVNGAAVLLGRDSRLNSLLKRTMVWCQPARSPSWQDSDTERVLGIGGYFMRAADPVALGAWYRDCLGLDADENGLWRQEAGPTVFATFESETDYFGSHAQQAMLNFRASVDSAGSPIPRATGSSCGSPPDRVFTQALTCR